MESNAERVNQALSAFDSFCENNLAIQPLDQIPLRYDILLIKFVRQLTRTKFFVTLKFV